MTKKITPFIIMSRSSLRNDNVEINLDLRAQKAQETIHQLEKNIENLKNQNKDYRREISHLAATEGDFSAEIKRLNEAIRANSKEIDANKKAINKERENIDLSRMTAADLKKELRKLQGELARTSKSLNPQQWRETEKRVNECREALARAEKPTKNLLQWFKTLPSVTQVVQGTFLAFGNVIADYVVSSFKNLINTVQDFEQSNSRLAAVLGTNKNGISSLTEQAKLLGRTTTATASEVTGLQTELAKLGFSQDVIEKMTPSTLKFAKSVGTDLSSAAAFAGAAMRMFNKDASEADEVMATFAVATTKSALDFQKLENSLSTVGPVANAFGFSVEDTTALLGQLANAGFDASSAATATRNILLNLADSNGDLAQALGGPVKNLDELVTGLQKLNGEGIDLAKALELTDKRSVAAFATFLNGADSMIGLRNSITGCTDDFQAMSDTMADNAAGAWAGFESAVEGLVLKFSGFSEVLKTAYEWATEFVNWIGGMIDALTPLGIAVSYVGKMFAAIIVTVAKVVKWFTDLCTQSLAMKAFINSLLSVLAAYKVAVLAAAVASKKAALATQEAAVATKKYELNLGKAWRSAVNFVKGLWLNVKALGTNAAATFTATRATKGFTMALLTNPITAFVAVIAIAATAIYSFVKKEEEAEEATDSWTQAMQGASGQYAEQKSKIQALIAVAENENVSLKRRKEAVDKLNSIIPGYNAQIDETTGKYKASKKALDSYLLSLQKEMRFKAYQSLQESAIQETESARIEADEAEIYYNQNKTKKNWIGWTVDNKDARKKRDEARKKFKAAQAKEAQIDKSYKKALAAGIIEAPEELTSTTEVEKATGNIASGMSKAADAGAETVTRLKEINAELKKLRKIDPSSDEEFDRIQKRIKLLQEEKKQLTGKAKTKKGKHETGTYKEDSIDEVEAPIDDKHQKKLLEINKEDIPQLEKAIKKNQELIRYCNELDQAYEKMKGEVKSTHTQTLDKLQELQNKVAADALKAQQELNSAMVKRDEENHKKRLESSAACYESLAELTRNAAQQDPALQQATELYLLNIEKESHEERLKELKRYQDEVGAADYYSADERKKVNEQLSKEIRSVQSQLLTDSGKFSEMLREAMTDTTSAAGIKQTYDDKISGLSLYYDEMKRQKGLSDDEIVALETEKQRRLAALRFEYSQQVWQLQELTGITWGQEYKKELEQLENYHRQGLIKEKDYQRKRLEMGVEHTKKYFDYYSQLSGSMFSAIQDAEIAMSEAKYDVLIQQAKNNGEDTAALEEEKENKKLEIQKKYADVNFAIKVSQIVADTAVSIMKAFADLGPIGGAVAAALLSATGIAQAVQAKAERDKVKNMQPSNTSGASSSTVPATAERVLKGYSDGGYTGDGGRYEVAGVVHRGEYVVPKPIMNDRRVVDAVGMIEAIRLNRAPAPPTGAENYLRGFADGGFTSSPELASVNLDEFKKTVDEFKKAVANIRAYVVLKDIERAQNSLALAKAPFTKNSNK